MSKSRNYTPVEKKIHEVKKMKNSRTKYPDIDYNDGIDEVVDFEETTDPVEVQID